MAALSVAAEVIGRQAVETRLRRLEERALELHPALAEAGKIIEEGLRHNFETQGRHFGKPWPALAASTLERKARMGQPTEPMKATGALEASLSGGAGKVIRLGPASIIVGTREMQARFAQGGTGHEPARTVVAIAKRDRAKVYALLRRHFTAV